MNKERPGNLSFFMAVMSVMALRYNVRDTHPWEHNTDNANTIRQIKDILPSWPDLGVIHFDSRYPVPMRQRLGIGVDYRACKSIVDGKPGDVPVHEHYLIDPSEFSQACCQYYGFVQDDAFQHKLLLPKSLAETLMIQTILASSRDFLAPTILGRTPIPNSKIFDTMAEQAIDILIEPMEEDSDFDDKLAAELAPAMAVIYMAHHLASYVVSDYCAQIHGDPNHSKYLSSNNLAYKFDPTQSLPMVAGLFADDRLGGNYPWRGFIERISGFLGNVNGQNSPTFTAVKNILGFTEAAQFAMGGISIDEFMAGLGQDKSDAWEKLPDTIDDEMAVYFSANRRPVDRGFRQMARQEFVDLQQKFSAETSHVMRIIDSGRESR